MTILLLTSATGAPGVTTTALGLTLAWPRDALLVDADRTPAQAVLAGYLKGTSGATGLGELARIHREQRTLDHELLRCCVPLPELEVSTHRRLFLPGFTGPGAAALFATVWPDLVEALDRVEATGLDVIIDAGRIGDGLPGPLLARADRVLLLTHTSLRALAGTRLYLPQLTQRAAQVSARGEVGLLLVGEGRPYPAKEIADRFRVPVHGSLPLDPEAAALWSDGAPATRRTRGSKLARAFAALASEFGVPAPRATEVTA
ncbi:hypothetical protein [Granulicoccus phenolivorans]|uniref:hypothetical protein n=1 Tax=Granulicoccus phenolivorans TaxID=266854 RepID=UPI0003F52C24|nr:hypothetical protein [Granulicoccus phenolivorans]